MSSAQSGLELRVGNKYRLGRKIGSGSFGDIYLGAFEAGGREDTASHANARGARRGDDMNARVRRVRVACRARDETTDDETVRNWRSTQGRTSRRTRKWASSWCVRVFVLDDARRARLIDIFVVSRSNDRLTRRSRARVRRRVARRSTRSCCTNPGCTKSCKGAPGCRTCDGTAWRVITTSW